MNYFVNSITFIGVPFARLATDSKISYIRTLIDGVIRIIDNIALLTKKNQLRDIIFNAQTVAVMRLHLSKGMDLILNFTFFNFFLCLQM